jgi:hypothetical protein
LWEIFPTEKQQNGGMYHFSSSDRDDYFLGVLAERKQRTAGETLAIVFKSKKTQIQEDLKL